MSDFKRQFLEDCGPVIFICQYTASFYRHVKSLKNGSLANSWGPVPWFAVWLSGNALVSINVVTLRWARLVPGWMTVFGRINYLSM